MISDVFAKLNPGGGNGEERLPEHNLRAVFGFGDTATLFSLPSSERKKRLQRRDILLNLIEQNQMLETVD